MASLGIPATCLHSIEPSTSAASAETEANQSSRSCWQQPASTRKHILSTRVRSCSPQARKGSQLSVSSAGNGPTAAGQLASLKLGWAQGLSGNNAALLRVQSRVNSTAGGQNGGALVWAVHTTPIMGRQCGVGPVRLGHVARHERPIGEQQGACKEAMITRAQKGTKESPEGEFRPEDFGAPPPPKVGEYGIALTQMDKMDLEFGRLMGEDPNVTLSKIIARKRNPDATYLQVQKDAKKNLRDPPPQGAIKEYKYTRTAQEGRASSPAKTLNPTPSNPTPSPSRLDTSSGSGPRSKRSLPELASRPPPLPGMEPFRRTERAGVRKSLAAKSAKVGKVGVRNPGAEPNLEGLIRKPSLYLANPGSGLPPEEDEGEDDDWDERIVKLREWNSRETQRAETGANGGSELDKMARRPQISIADFEAKLAEQGLGREFETGRRRFESREGQEEEEEERSAGKTNGGRVQGLGREKVAEKRTGSGTAAVPERLPSLVFKPLPNLMGPPGVVPEPAVSGLQQPIPQAIRQDSTPVAEPVPEPLPKQTRPPRVPKLTAPPRPAELAPALAMIDQLSQEAQLERENSASKGNRVGGNGSSLESGSDRGIPFSARSGEESDFKARSSPAGGADVAGGDGTANAGLALSDWSEEVQEAVRRSEAVERKQQLLQGGETQPTNDLPLTPSRRRIDLPTLASPPPPRSSAKLSLKETRPKPPGVPLPPRPPISPPAPPAQLPSRSASPLLPPRVLSPSGPPSGGPAPETSMGASSREPTNQSAEEPRGTASRLEEGAPVSSNRSSPAVSGGEDSSPTPTQRVAERLPPIRPPVSPKPIAASTIASSATERVVPASARDGQVASPKGPRSGDRPEKADLEALERSWARAEALFASQGTEEVSVVASNNGGVLVTFDSMIAFVPSSQLTAKRRPPPFFAWANMRGIDVSWATATSAPDAGASIVGDADVASPPAADVAPPPGAASGVPARAASTKDGNGSKKREAAVAEVASANGGLPGVQEQEEIRQLYKRERYGLLASLVGQKLRVKVVSVDRAKRQLILSERIAEEDPEAQQRKEALMASLRVGDVVKGKVTLLTSYGVFVDVQGVEAMIHASELSWTRAADPTALLTLGQEVEAKVVRLDILLRRIQLSVKQLQPDPLLETLDSLVESGAFGDPPSGGAAGGGLLEYVSEGRASGVTAMVELDGVVQRLQAAAGIEAVTLGRRLRGSALAPAFQVYMSGQLEGGYKLLARAGPEVQEVLVTTTLDRERMKEAIRAALVVEE